MKFRCLGWTLTGMMVAVTVCTLLILLATQTFLFNQLSTRQTIQLAQLQQTGQFVLGLFQHELRNANFLAGVMQLPVMPANFTMVSDCRNSGDSGSFPLPHQSFSLLQTGIVGGSNQLNCLSNAINQSGFIQIKRLAGERVNHTALRSNRAYLEIHQGQTRFVFNNSADLSDNAQYWPFLHQVFYLAQQRQAGKTVPVLMRKRLIRQQGGGLTMDTESVIEGVEAIVFELGSDTNGDQVADVFTEPNSIQPPKGLAHGVRVKQIRFHILVRSVEPDPTFTNNQQYQLGPSRFDAPGDHYRRLQISSAVTLLN